MNANNQNNENAMPFSAEEIKAIGEIELGPSKHEVFLNNHYKKLLWGGIALGIIGGSAIAWFSFQQDRKDAAAAEIIAAQDIPENSPERYKSTSLNIINQQYGNTPSAQTANLMSGLNLLWGEQPEDGITYLKEHILSHAENDLLRARAYASLAIHYQENNNLPQARQQWMEVTRLSTNPYTALAYISLGDIAKEEGNIEEARTLYNQASSTCQTSALVTDKIVSARLLLLNVDDPRPIPPEPARQDTPNSLFNMDDLPGNENNETGLPGSTAPAKPF